MRYAKLVLVVALLIGATCYTWADLALPSDTPIELKFHNWDVGTLYISDAAGGPITPGVLYEGGALASLGQILPPNANPGEDGWGVFNLTGISNLNTAATIWSGTAAGGTGGQIAGIFWGLHDTKMYQLDASTERIQGIGVQFAFYYFPTGDPFDFTLGPANRTLDGAVYLPEYPTATDVGTLLWTGVAVPGFATVPGGFVGAGTVDPTVSFESTYNTSANTSLGGFLADLQTVSYVDGSAVVHFLTGSQNDAFAPVEWAPGYFADMKFRFTADTIGAGPWLLRSNDPGNATTAPATPECSSIVLLLSALGPLGLRRLRRKRA